MHKMIYISNRSNLSISNNNKKKMNSLALVSIIFTLTLVVSLAIIFLTLSYLAIKTYSGKSVTDPSYPPVKGTLFGLVVHYSRVYDHLTDLATNSPTFRLLTPAATEVFTVDARNVEHVLKDSFESFSKGDRVKEIIGDLLGHGILLADGHNWKSQRKLASFEFSTGFLRDFSCVVFRGNAVKLATVVHGFALQCEAFDVQELLMRCTLDSICKVGFGVELKCLEGSNKEGLAFMKAFDDSHLLTIRRYIDPFWKLKKLLNIGSEAILKKNIRLVDEFVSQLIQKRRKMLEDGKHCNAIEDILSRFLVESKKNPEEMNDKYLRDIFLSFTFAGKDTSANTLSWFLYMLCKNPIVQEKVVQELREVIGDNAEETSIESFVEKITEKVLDQMQYLHAALTETLRLYPAVAVGSRSADKDDVLPDGFKVKKGDVVNYLAYGMGRMTNIWGDNALDFRPERWLEDGIFQPQSPFKFVAFHAGPRICLGKDFAYRQMKILSIALLYLFRFRLADESKPVKYKIMFTLHIEDSLSLRAVPRTGVRANHTYRKVLGNVLQ